MPERFRHRTQSWPFNLSWLKG